MSRKDRKFKRFFRQKLGDLQKKKKKKKKVFAEVQGDFSSKISQLQTFQGGLFSHGGGYFQFFTENRPQKHKKHAILHTSQANGGGSSPPRPPPGYATGNIQCVQDKIKDWVQILSHSLPQHIAQLRCKYCCRSDQQDSAHEMSGVAKVSQ